VDKIERLSGAASPTASIDSPAALRPAVPRRRARWWLELLTIGWLLWIYEALTNLAPLRLQSALVHAEDVLGFEQSLHLAPERALDHWLAANRTLGVLVSDYYDNAHFIVTLGLLGLLWWRRADIYRPLRNALVLINLIGFVVFWLFPTAPPRMLGGFIDVVSETGAFGSSHGTGVLAGHADELAAMPSLHIAWAAWCAVALWRMSPRRWVRAIAVLYPCLTTFAVLATGNHFLVDVVAGFATAALAMGGVRLGRTLLPRSRAVLRVLRARMLEPLQRGARAHAPRPTAAVERLVVRIRQTAWARPRSACHKLVTKSETG
jgi:hypothetical protein